MFKLPKTEQCHDKYNKKVNLVFNTIQK